MSSAFPATIPVRLNEEGFIDIDVHCPACGYNLRMQKVANTCPECGAAVDVVERDDTDRLELADAGWLKRIERGTRWLHGGALATIFFAVPGIVWGAAALWLLTTKEPNRPETWYHRGTRLSARWASVLAAVAALATLVLLVARVLPRLSGISLNLGTGPTGVSPLLRIQRAVVPSFSGDWGTFDLLACTAAAAMAVAMLEAWRHLFALAARADGPAVAQRCRATWKRYLVGVGAIVGLATVTNVVDYFDWRLPPWLYEWTALILLGVVLAVVVWIWWATVKLTADFRRLLLKKPTD
ncbi:MAG: hypothetical protein AAGH99_10135 [Planctomycetota bacterium]